MRTRLLRAIKLNAAVIVIALFAFSSLAQQSSQLSEPAASPCNSNNGSELLKPNAGQNISPGRKTKVGLFTDHSNTASWKCGFLSFTAPGGKPLSKETSGELFNFDSHAVGAGTASTSFTSKRSAQTRAPQDSATEAQELAKKLSNPVASLISFPMQSNFDFGMGTGSGWRYTLNVQPVIPIALSPKWNVISRTIVPIIHQSNVAGPTSQSGLGDTVQSLFFSPNKSEPFIWAVGPVFLLPTATDARLGSQKWGVGPTALALKQKNGWTYGALVNHIWSVAGKANRGEVNATFVQPFLAYTNKQAWTYTLNTESTYDWVSDSWSTPINFTISKLVRFGKQPISFAGGPKCWVTTPTGGPEGCGLRVVVTALFPKK